MNGFVNGGYNLMFIFFGCNDIIIFLIIYVLFYLWSFVVNMFIVSFLYYRVKIFIDD